MKRLLLGCLCILLLIFCVPALADEPDPETAEKMGLNYLKNVDPAVREEWIDSISLWQKTFTIKQTASFSVPTTARIFMSAKTSLSICLKIRLAAIGWRSIQGHVW